MHLDGFFFNCLAAEIRHYLQGTRVEDVYDSGDNTQVIQFRAPGQTLRLEISLLSPRAFFLTERGKGSKFSGTFAQTVKKHIAGKFCVAVNNPPFDRMAILSFAAVPQGQPNISLHIELMGRQNDIVLCEGETILASTRSPGRHSIRPLQPGDTYTSPPPAGKILPSQVSPEILQAVFENIGAFSLAQALVNSVLGISPTLAREICHRGGVGSDTPVSDAGACLADIARIIRLLAEDSLSGQTTPVLYQDPKVGPYWMQLHSKSEEFKTFPSLSAAIACWSKKKREDVILNSLKTRLRNVLSNSVRKLKRTLSKQECELKRAENFDRLRQTGDTLLAFIHSIPRGATSVTLNNIHTGEPMEIKLAPDKSVSANASYYFKRYTKYKNARNKVKRQIKANREQLDYLYSLEYALDTATVPEEIREIQAEMEEQKLVRKKNRAKASSPPAENFLSYTSPQGDLVLVGKNNKQNEILTLRKARKDYYWLHCRHFPGSHVILCTTAPEDSALEYAASLAAWHSKARSSPKVEVVWTQVKNVKKIPGSKPGMVQYTDYRSAFIEPRAR